MPGQLARLSLHLGGAEIGLALRRSQADGAITSDRLLVTDSGRDGQGLIAAVDELLKSTGTSLEDLESIAFAAGPGGFSRVRVACAFAQGLGLAKSCPVVPVNSLQALSLAVISGHMLKPGTRVLALVDARMQEAYCAVYVSGSDSELIPVLEPALIKITELEGHFGDWGRSAAGATIVLCGDAWNRYGISRLFPEARISMDPPADAIAAACLALSDATQWVSPANAGPIYLRDKIALNIAEQAALRAQNAKASTKP